MDMQYALREGVLTVRLFGELGHHEAIQGMARLAGQQVLHQPGQPRQAKRVLTAAGIQRLVDLE